MCNCNTLRNKWCIRPLYGNNESTLLTIFINHIDISNKKMRVTIIISFKFNYTMIGMRYFNNFTFQNQQHYSKVTWSMTSDIVWWWENKNMLCGHIYDGTLDNKLTTTIFSLHSFLCFQSLDTLRFIKWSLRKRIENNLSNKSK